MTRARRAETENRVLSSGVGKIRPRARLIRTIGAELISSEVVAVIEIVRNSWDADARAVEIIFRDSHLPDVAALEIRDDGHGMTKEILLGPWLEPATGHKACSETPFGGKWSPEGRRRLGSKGVGRFATQRLGQHLRLESKTRKMESRLDAQFDWESLDSDEHYLDQMEIQWQAVETPTPEWHGTSLKISQLRDRWTLERFQRLRLGLSRLLGPGLEEGEFRIFLNIDGLQEEIRPALDATRPMYSLQGEVLEGGICSLRYTDVAGAEEEWERTVLWPAKAASCAGPLRFRLDVWDLDREAVERYFEITDTRMGLRDFRRIIRDHSGVSLYRDGFRILPYGESDNDWLRLDRRRVNNPTLRLSNNQVLGQLQLTADGNPHLKDQTNREGLVTNEAYNHLQQLVLELFSYLEARRFRARRQLAVGQRPGSTVLPLAERESDQEIEQLLVSLEEPGPCASESPIQALRTLLDIRHLEYSDAIRQYAGLAAAGQLSGLVFSQIKHPLGNLSTEIACIEDTLEDTDLAKDEREDLHCSLAKMRRILQEMQIRVERLDPFALPGKNRNVEEARVVSCLEGVQDAFLDRFSAQDIDPELIVDHDLTVRTDSRVLRNAVALIVENSIYWLSLRKPRRRHRFRVTSDSVLVENNGPAIPRSARAELFAPHFTTREGASGMGLTLARDLLRSVGASVRLARSTRVWTTFEIQFSQPSS